MVFVESKIVVLDNCGAKLVKCIKILGKRKSASVGDLILVVVRKNSPNKKLVVSKKVYYGLLIHCCYPRVRLDGRYLLFKQNGLVILSDRLKFLGTRLRKPLCAEVRDIRFKLLVTRARLIL